MYDYSPFGDVSLGSFCAERGVIVQTTVCVQSRLQVLRGRAAAC